MSRSFSLALLVAIVALAWFLRANDGPLLESRAARSMRTIELGVASGAMPERDLWLDGARAGVRPTLFERITAAVAQRALADTSEDPSLRRIDEQRLEELARLLTRIFAALGVVAVFAALRVIAPGDRSGRLALSGALLFALLASARPQPVDPEPLALLLGLSGLALALAAQRARDLSDALVGGLTAGVLLGLASACEAQAGAYAVAAVAAGAWLAFCGSRPESLVAATASVYACAAAAAAVLVARGADSDVDAGPTLRFQVALIGAAVVFFGLRLDAKRGDPSRAPRPRWMGGAAAALAVAAWLALCATTLELHAGELRASGVWTLSAAAWIAGMLSTRLDATRVALIAWIAAALPASLSGASSMHLAAALTAGLAVSLSDFVPWRRRGLRGAAAAAIAIALFAAAEVGAIAIRPEYLDRAKGLAVVEGLRWMRTNTPSPGPWNHPGARPDWTVLCDPELGPALAYHARRAPVGAVGRGERPDEAALAARRTLYDLESEEFSPPIRALGARFVVIGACTEPAWLEAELRDGREFPRGAVFSMTGRGGIERFDVVHRDELGRAFQVVFDSETDGDAMHHADRGGADDAALRILGDDRTAEPAVPSFQRAR